MPLKAIQEYAHNVVSVAFGTLTYNVIENTNTVITAVALPVGWQATVLQILFCFVFPALLSILRFYLDQNAKKRRRRKRAESIATIRAENAETERLRRLSQL